MSRNRKIAFSLRDTSFFVIPSEVEKSLCELKKKHYLCIGQIRRGIVG